MSTLKDTDQAADIILDFIAGGIPDNRNGESDGNYNAIIGNARSTDDLSLKTINGIYLLQDQLLKSGKPSTAVGRYQIIRDTLKWLLPLAKVSPSERFTPDLQDRLAMVLLAQSGYREWLAGQIDGPEFAHRLSTVWASLPDPQNGGKSHYDGVGNNSASTTLGAVYAMLERAQAAVQDPAPKPSTPDLLPAQIAAAVKVVQTLLHDAGCDPGAVDGLWGPRTQAAMEAFRKQA